jgi:hypothetical protein
MFSRIFDLLETCSEQTFWLRMDVEYQPFQGIELKRIVAPQPDSKMGSLLDVSITSDSLGRTISDENFGRGFPPIQSADRAIKDHELYAYAGTHFCARLFCSFSSFDR